MKGAKTWRQKEKLFQSSFETITSAIHDFLALLPYPWIFMFNWSVFSRCAQFFPTRSRVYQINSFHDIVDTLQSIQKHSTSFATSQSSDLPSRSLGASICSLLTVLPLPSTSIASRIILQPNLALLSKHSIGPRLCCRT